jgi:hypothetical protein
MRLLCRNLARIVLAASLVSPVFVSGCAAHVRVYDPYYRDYHDWNGETVYYNQWEHDTHRDHVDFNKRNAGDQKAYWDWRHSQGQH